MPQLIVSRAALRLVGFAAFSIILALPGESRPQTPSAAQSTSPGECLCCEDQACVCDDCCCCDSECDPWLTVRAGALALHRSSNQTHVLLSDQATGQTLLSTSDAAPGWAAGPEIDVLVRALPEVDFQFNWFSLDEWSNQRFVDVGGAVVDPLGAPLTSAQLETWSTFHNFEFNFRRGVSDDVTILAGFRYVELDDAFRIRYDDSGSGLSEDANVRARNRLYGFQLGADAALWRRGPWALNGWMKAGIFGNAARANTDIVFSGVPLASIRARDSDVAFIGDLGLRATRRLGTHAEVYAGYRLMWVDGVALAANQYDSIVAFFSSGNPQMLTDGSPFYHGAELGLTFAF